MSPSLLASLRFEVDSVSALFLALFGVVWLVSGIHAAVTIPAEERTRFFAYYVPASVGGLAVAVAGDAISFYICFSLMALASWGLVNHHRTAETRRAGAIYLTLTAISEAALLVALIILSVSAGSTELAAFGAVRGAAAELAAVFVLVAVGLKIGALPAIGALPLTYAAAPAGAAAVLAGASAKVGALAMLRLLPFGALPESWSHVVMGLGLATAFIAALVGLFTTSPRAVLGYSSSSQMGLIVVAAGAALSLPAAIPLAHGAIAALALHHGLAKSALILGADALARSRGRARTWMTAALALPAMALVGVPLTSGFVGKYALKDAVLGLPGAFPELVYALLPWTAVGTALLMLRFFLALRQQPDREPRLLILPGVATLLFAVAGAAWLYPAVWNDHALESALYAGAVWPALWPGLLAVAVAFAAIRIPRVMRTLGTVPPGDLLLGAERLVRLADHALRAPKAPAVRANGSRLQRLLMAAESYWVSWPVAAAIFILLVLAAAALTAR